MTWKEEKPGMSQIAELKTIMLVFFFFFLIYLFIYFWLCWVFVSVRGLSLVVASGGHSSSRCAGLSLSRPPPLRSTGSRRAGSVIVAHGPSCSTACGIFPDQGSNPCPLHWAGRFSTTAPPGKPPIMLVLMRCIQVGMRMPTPTSASSCYPWFSGTMFRGDHFISLKQSFCYKS